MFDLKQSTAITAIFFAHDVNGDGVTGLVDAGFTKRISKGSGAFAAMTVTITEMENGFYSFPLSTAHSDTLGVLTMSFSHASCKRVNMQYRVHARLPDDLAYPAVSGRSSAIDASGRHLADIDTIKTNPVVNAGTVTFPTTATLASTTNITAATGVVLSGVTHTGAVIPTVSAVTGLTAANLDAAVSSRMATYTQPTGFLAATFPAGTVANTTNITAGTVTTATNVTTVNGLAAGVITAASIAAAGLNGKGDWNVGKTGYAIAVGGIGATAFAAGAIDSAAIAADAIGASELAQDAAQEIADEVLNRNIAGGGSGNTRNVRNALRAIRNKVSEDGGTLTVTQEDDITAAWTATVTRTAGKDPITNVDPI